MWSAVWARVTRGRMRPEQRRGPSTCLPSGPCVSSLSRSRASRCCGAPGAWAGPGCCPASCTGSQSPGRPQRPGSSRICGQPRCGGGPGGGGGARAGAGGRRGSGRRRARRAAAGGRAGAGACGRAGASAAGCRARRRLHRARRRGARCARRRRAGEAVLGAPGGRAGARLPLRPCAGVLGRNGGSRSRVCAQRRARASRPPTPSNRDRTPCAACPAQCAARRAAGARGRLSVCVCGSQCVSQGRA